jgi:ADP-ribosylglycohydrolase
MAPEERLLLPIHECLPTRSGWGTFSRLAHTLDKLQEKPGHEETTNAIKQAVQFADEYELSPVNVEKPGSRWVAEEALAISLFCALKATDFRTGVLASVNHSGDSDSTGSICGNILGTLSGIDAIPDQWKANVEGSDVITQLSHDFIDVFITDGENANVDKGRYPPG